MPIMSLAPGRRMRWRRICWTARCALLLLKGIRIILFLQQMKLPWKSWGQYIFRPGGVRSHGGG